MNFVVLTPGWVWQGGPTRRALGTGIPTGLFLGAFALVESGYWIAAAAVFLLLSPLHGIRTARRMGRAWSGAAQLDAADRAAVVRATRRGADLGDPRLAPAVIDYAEALRNVREQDRIRRWVVAGLAMLALALALYDTHSGEKGQAVASWLVLALFLLDLTWRPGQEDTVVSRAQRAADSARRSLRRNPADDRP
ncbi:hypothetical protein [Streptomyces sp. NPDC002265]|uniref:hypothetical protein n=1 Tax=Streptomyces sp. NPDC002265 TaxID=3154415 RepID=UPI0033214DFA